MKIQPIPWKKMLWPGVRSQIERMAEEQLIAPFEKINVNMDDLTPDALLVCLTYRTSRLDTVDRVFSIPKEICEASYDAKASYVARLNWTQ
jgi:hypothetical protein